MSYQYAIAVAVVGRCGRCSGRAWAAGTSAMRWIDSEHVTGDEWFETGAVVLDGTLPVSGCAASTGVLELVRRHPRP